MGDAALGNLGGRFVLEALVGSGGMGSVYRARDVLRDQQVALKILESLNAADVGRFAREARLLVELSHPAIVGYVAHGNASGRHYLAMEWLEGTDLADRLAKRGLSVDETLRLARRVASGLAAAHAQGIIHRDIKPSNLLLVDEEPSRAKILDFGIARAGAGRSPLTRSGAVVGTAGYMSPEQATGAEDIDARSDVFALGCVLYECLTGRPAFAGEHVLAVLAKILLEPSPRPRALLPDLPEELDALVVRMMAKERADRPRDAAEVLALLDDLGPAPVSVARPGSIAPRPLTTSEQRFVSLVVLDFDANAEWAHTITPEQARRDDARLRAVAQRFDAQVTPLGTAARILTLGAHGSATAQAAHAASAALALKTSLPEARVALATGRAELDGERVPVGPVIDRAALLMVAWGGRDDAVRIDEVTASLLDSSFTVLDEGGLLWLEGREATSDEVRPLMGKRTPFVGREKELALLAATLEESIAEPIARAVVVTAPPGTGKSRLRQEFVAHVERRGEVKVLIARGDAVGAGSAFGLVRKLVQSIIEPGDAAPSAVRERLARYLSAVLPQADVARTTEFLAELIDVPTDTPSPQLRAARNDPRILSDRMRRAFVDWLQAECELSPVLVLLEDLHWGDLPSVSYLGDALRALASRPLLVVAFARPEVHDVFPKLWAAEGAQEVRLAGLTRSASERLVRHVLGETVSPKTLGEIVDRADGNAFYLEELIRRVAESGASDLPETVLAMVQARLHALEPEARRVLRAASIFGERFTERGVAALLGKDTRPEDIANRVRALVDLELVLPASGEHAQAEFAFRHGLVRETAYATLTPEDRASGHALAGQWLESAGSRDALALAEHYERGGDLARARPWLLRAAFSARDGGNVSAALDLARRAQETKPEGEDLGLLRALEGECHAWRLDWLASLASSREAIRLLPRHSPHWFLAVSTTIYAGATLGDLGAMLDVVDLERDLDASVPANGPFALALGVMIVGVLQVGQRDRALAVLDALDRVGAAQVDADPAFVGWWQLGRVSPLVYAFDDLATARSAGATALEQLTLAGDQVGIATALLLTGQTLVELGALDEAVATCLACEERAKTIGLTYVEDWARTYRARILLRSGAIDEAIEVARPVADTKDMYRSLLAHGLLAEAALARGSIAEAHAAGERLASLPLPLPHVLAAGHALLAATAIARGDFPAAVEHADAGLQHQATSGVPYVASQLRERKIIALDALGETTRAEEARREAHARCARIAAPLPPRYRASYLALPSHRILHP